jgi:hypothetical protein
LTNIRCFWADDLWAGDFTLTSDGSDLQDMTWNVIAIQSPTKPAARYNHAASSVGGLVRILVLSVLSFFSDFVRFS